MDGSKINGAMVRLTGGNQIVVMLCAIHVLVFRVEDNMVLPVDTELQSCQLSNAVTLRSTTDYICYSTFNGMWLTAVLLKTKAEYHRNVLAQSLGYYIQACSNIWKSGVCVIATKDTMQLGLFSFINKQAKPFVNGIALKPFNYMET